MDRLEAMSTFLTVVEQGSLSAAARRLKTPLTTVSRNVSELESHLRTKLFNRSSRQLVLTDTGTSYVAACKRILADVSEAERTASGEYAAPTGELAVTTPLGLGRVILMPIIADFLKTYPDIKVRMIPTDQKLVWLRSKSTSRCASASCRIRVWLRYDSAGRAEWCAPVPPI